MAKTTKENSLDEARRKINDIDREMAALFEKRMTAAEAIAEYKMERGLAVYDGAREDEVIRQNSALIKDERVREYYVNFLRATMSVSREYQSRIMTGLKIAYSGTEGAFAHIAASRLYPTAEKIAFSDFASAYRAVEEGKCDLAVLPVENSYNGEVGQVTDLMFSGTLYVNRILELAVTHDLLSVKGAEPAKIKKVVSHPQALAQCAKYIRAHGYETQEFSNTALAAKYVAELADTSVAAIASAEAAELFGLSVADHDINTSRGNTTRFAVFSRISNKRAPRETGVHSILLFTVKNEAGALAKAIEVIGSHGYNMRTLRSRPMKKLLWEYYFYVEAEGNVQTEDGLSMMEELSEFCDKLKFAGTYTKN